MGDISAESASMEAERGSETEQVGGRALRRMVFEAHFENLERVRELAGQEARAYGLGEDAVYAVQLAVDEAFSNIIEHAYGCECDEQIECTYEITDEGLVITMRDCGAPFNPESVPEPDLHASLEERQVGGLGFYFIRQLMDEVSFTFIPPQGEQKGCNVLRMVKRKEA